MVSKQTVPAIVAVLVLLSIAGVTPANAQVPKGSGSDEPGHSSVRRADRPEWGGSDLVLQTVGFSEFTPSGSHITYTDNFLGGRFSNNGAGDFYATLHVPSGVLLTYLELDYYDDSPSVNVSLQLFDCTFLSVLCSTLGSVQSSGVPGFGFASVDLTPMGYITNNNTRRLFLRAITQSGDFSNRIIGAYIGYKLQVSPAPASATFPNDTPTTHPYFRFIEALARSGITAGCSPGSYCPNSPITRGEMAVFLSVALGLHFPN